MKILVTGGAGFIGSHVCEALLKTGHDVYIYDNFSDYYLPEYKRDNVKHVQFTAKECCRSLVIVEGDIQDSEALDQCFRQHSLDAVIHLAACAGVRPSIEDAPLYIDVNLMGTTNILECMKNHEIKKLVFASSSSVYGNSEKTPFRESDAVDNPISPYAATKKAGELICYTYHHLYDINTACLRFFTVYGPRQRPDLAIYKFTDKIYKNESIPFYGDGSMGRDYTYIDDIVSGILLALDWTHTGVNLYEIFNLGESYTVSLKDMLKTIENTTKKAANILQMPVPPGDVNVTCADISKAKQVLGYNPGTPFNMGIEKFVAWYEAERLIKI
ncbi:MAG: GDP-mannose 4,6-dehydratase [Defluviitaleaceae bacterium]|nr:GDP-mannose 4,6-dehydratase [Defluviitaleaceae bacterium]